MQNSCFKLKHARWFHLNCKVWLRIKYAQHIVMNWTETNKGLNDRKTFKLIGQKNSFKHPWPANRSGVKTESTAYLFPVITKRLWDKFPYVFLINHVEDQNQCQKLENFEKKISILKPMLWAHFRAIVQVYTWMHSKWINLTCRG